MKAVGIVRQVDALGRILIPAETLKSQKIKKGDPMEVFLDGECVVFRKYVSEYECLISRDISTENLVLANGKLVLSRAAAKQILAEIEKANLT